MRRILLLLLCGCGTTPQAPPAIEGAERFDPVATTTLKLFHAETLLGPADADAAPALRFDLSKLTGVRRAVLRFRRAYQDRPHPFTVHLTNVNKGLRVTRHEEGRILDAEPTDREADVWGGIHLARYANQFYGEYLRGLNANVSTKLAAGEAWDDLDVTQFVRDEIAGDRSLTILLSTPTVVNLRWEDAHLLVQSGEPERKKVAAKLSIRSTPAPAKIFVDDEFVGTTVADQAVEVPVSSDRVRLRLEKKGCKVWQETLRISGDVPVHAELEPE